MKSKGRLEYTLNHLGNHKEQYQDTPRGIYLNKEYN